VEQLGVGQTPRLGLGSAVEQLAQRREPVEQLVAQLVKIG
jgi:hypothetical protein